jgi:pimeloyl-ACP methyl ester carboxylesterase
MPVQGTEMEHREARSWTAWRFVVGSLMLLSHLSANGEVTAENAIRWEPLTGVAFDGSPLIGELGRLRVPENRSVSRGATIELAFVRYRTSNPHPSPPIFFLAGGPGGSGVELCGKTATHPQIRLLEHADVIGLDQRGTGRSRPQLAGPPDFSTRIPSHVVVDRNTEIDAFRVVAKQCTEYWKGQGVDLTAYNSVESAEDIEAIRIALGLEQIVTYGTSYGSHLSLAYLRRHAVRVARAIAMKVEGYDHTWKRPSIVQRQLMHLHDLAAASPSIATHLPDLAQTVRGLLDQLSNQPARVMLSEGGSPPHSIVLSAHDLRRELSRMLAETDRIARVPALLHEWSQGNWSELARLSQESRVIEAEAMPLMMDCASGASAGRRGLLQSELDDKENLLGDAISAPMYLEVCEGCGCTDLGDDFRGPVSCDVPILFVSGSLDVRTPPENVEEIRGGFSRHTHLLIRNTGHDARELMSPEYREQLQAFLRGEPVNSGTIELPAVLLEPVRASLPQDAR